MRKLQDIFVPYLKAPLAYTFNFEGEVFSFPNLKVLLGKADYPKAGDKNAGLCAKSEVEREAARSVLSDLSIQHLYDNPLSVNDRVDEVMRVNYDIDLDKFKSIAHLTLGELKDHLMASDGDEIKAVGRALTGVMASALAKLCDTHELIYIASKVENASTARTLLGTRGTLSSRLQPNHPTDDLNSIALLVYTGLSMGSGDALLGVNPANENVDTISTIYRVLDDIRRKTGAPTQICVLSHVKTVMQCLLDGAPVEILFQSLAGTESTNLTEFDISVQTLDEAYQLVQEKSPLIQENPDARCMYFETGQGSEYTYGKHDGMDMTTCEALCYGLARRYDPFMVNNVTGFIGPETHVDNFEMIISNLQDHFMGKLLGLPMGMAPCYTLHSQITLEGQQMATQLLTSAGANYYMAVHLNTDRMLAYFDTSGHDDQTMREIYNRTTAPEFTEWAIKLGIFEQKEDGSVIRGPNWGDPSIFISKQEIEDLKQSTPVMHDFANAGPRPINRVSREVKMNQAYARDAIYKELEAERLQQKYHTLMLQTLAEDKHAYLNDPELGSRLNPTSVETLLKTKSSDKIDVQIVISDGLSANAVHANIDSLLEVITDGLKAQGLSLGQTITVNYGRVKLADHIAELLNPEIIIYLIGERPGGTAAATKSLSCYYCYNLSDPSSQKAAADFSGHTDVRYEYSVLSNIYEKGLPPIEAGSVIVETVKSMKTYKAAGNRLESLSNKEKRVMPMSG
ncbi:ethanolamine ammonia-lyase subunit EutB [Thiomicrorhabdus sp.]|uniref:ethanolamine ammonia-lyase subunit EutB n=1 Tax=Thiomicrorhabdus sp. TaxID=2039724 RepID=UPI0029C70CA5|nr:ethanolamine ammonia-lyase subunit EutB [Thiomicrorhabdus sp.]